MGENILFEVRQSKEGRGLSLAPFLKKGATSVLSPLPDGSCKPWGKGVKYSCKQEVRWNKIDYLNSYHMLLRKLAITAIQMQKESSSFLF